MRFRIHATLFVLTCTLPLTATAQDDVSWPAFGGSGGDFRVPSLQNLVTAPLRLAWQAEIGTGESGIVVSGDRVFATALLKQAAEFKNEDELFERVLCLNRTTGKAVWSKQYRVEKRDDQESFGATKRSPKATPAIVGDRLVTLGFTGQLRCWSIADGSLQWEHDLVKEYGAKAVQFGYSGSPVPASDTTVLVMIGGEKGGLTCFSTSDGKAKWMAPIDNASYATPVLCSLAGTKQIVAHSQNQIIGFDRSTGQQLWEWALPKSGLTNVPTPLPISGDRMLISGQGVEGTACLQINRDGEKWNAKQLWLTKRVQFFYCNWMTSGKSTVIACNDKLLFGLNASTGKILGRWRGYGNGNLVSDSKTVMLLHGDGKLSFLNRTPDGLKLATRYRFPRGRYWVPPTVVGDQLLVRSGSKLICAAPGGNGEIERVKTNPEDYNFTNAPARDYVGEIVVEFEKSGAASAFALYKRLHKSEARRFSLEQRNQLAELAAEQDLTEFREQILTDAEKLFSDDKPGNQP